MKLPGKGRQYLQDLLEKIKLVRVASND